MDANITATAPALAPPAAIAPFFMGVWPVFPAIPNLLPLSVPLPQLPLKLLTQMSDGALLASGVPSLADIASRVRALFIPSWLDVVLGTQLSPYLTVIRPWVARPRAHTHLRLSLLTPHALLTHTHENSPCSGLHLLPGPAPPLPAPVPAALPGALPPGLPHLRRRHCVLPAPLRDCVLAGPRSLAGAAGAGAPAGPQLQPGPEAGRPGGGQGQRRRLLWRWRGRLRWHWRGHHALRGACHPPPCFSPSPLSICTAKISLCTLLLVCRARTKSQ